MRRALGLTQEESAARYHIPLGTLRDWRASPASERGAHRARAWHPHPDADHALGDAAAVGGAVGVISFHTKT